MPPGDPPSVTVTTLGSAACAALVFRTAGQLRVAVAVKATFVIAQGRAMVQVDPDPIVRADQHRDGTPASALTAASELVPYRPRADVLLQGHARAPQGRPTPAMALRLMVSRDQAVPLDKRLVARGTPDPSGKPGEPAPFLVMPLVYEVAAGGPRAPGNPVGVAEGPGRWANLVDPRKPGRPAGFGPISPRWQARRRLLSVDAAILAAPIPDLPGDFAWAYFNAAPEDQRLDFLRGDEWVGFEGMNSQIPRVQSCLPGVRGQARVHGLPGGPPGGKPIALEADTLTLDTDKLRCSVVWRGSFPVASLAELGQLHVLAGVESAEHPLAFPVAPATAARPPPAASPSRIEVVADATAPGDDQTLDTPGRGGLAATPFQPTPAADPSATGELTPALLARVRAASAMPFAPSAPTAPRRPAQSLPAATPFDHAGPLIAPPRSEPGDDTVPETRSPFRDLALAPPVDTSSGGMGAATTQPIPRVSSRSALPFQAAAPGGSAPNLPAATPFERGALAFEVAAPARPPEPPAGEPPATRFDRAAPIGSLELLDDMSTIIGPSPLRAGARAVLPFGPSAPAPSREGAPNLPAATPFDQGAAPLERPPAPTDDGEMTMVVDGSLRERVRAGIAARAVAAPPPPSAIDVVVPIQIAPPRIAILEAPVVEAPVVAAPADGPPPAAAKASLGGSFLAAMARARKTPASASP